LILDGDGKIGPVEERVPDSKVELGLILLWGDIRRYVYRQQMLHT